MKKLAVLPIVLLVTLVFAGVAQATPPVPGQWAGSFDFEVFPCNETLHVWDHEVVSADWMEYYDAAGNWVWTNWHEKDSDHLYNHELGYDKSRVLAGPYEFNCHLVPYTGECEGTGPGQCVLMKCSGTGWNIHVPKEGMLFHSAGFSDVLTFWPGGDMALRYTLETYKETGMGKYDGDTVCELLAP